MTYIRWIGLVACALAALGYLAAGSFNMAGLMLALTAICVINIRRVRERGEKPGRDKRDL